MSAEQRVETEFPVQRRTNKRVTKGVVVCTEHIDQLLRLTVEPNDRRFVLRSVVAPVDGWRAPTEGTSAAPLRSPRPAET